MQGSDELSDFIRVTFACPDEVARQMARRASERRYARRAAILRQGDDGAETLLMIEGRAHALLYGADGQMLLLHEFVSGDLFGAVSLAAGEAHEADVVAAEDVRAALFLALDFIGMIESHPSIGLAVSRQLLRQLRSTARRMAEHLTLSAAGRVHAELLRLARLGDGARISPAPVLSNLAVRVHSTRETVSRTISALERRGLLRREADALILTAPQRLEAMIV